ncbi:uncharacterized protein ACR2FA_009034 [Aphomia sociella]
MSSDSLLNLLASMRRDERSNVYCTEDEMKSRNLDKQPLSERNNFQVESFKCKPKEINVYENLRLDINTKNNTRYQSLDFAVKSQKEIETHKEVYRHDPTRPKYLNFGDVSSKAQVECKQEDYYEIDEEKHFSMMLIPMFKKLNEEQKHYAKVEILNVMNRARYYRPQSEHLGCMCSHSTRMQTDSFVPTEMSSRTADPDSNIGKQDSNYVYSHGLILDNSVQKSKLFNESHTDSVPFSQISKVDASSIFSLELNSESSRNTKNSPV